MSRRDADTQTRVLSKIEQDPDSTLQILTAKRQWLKNLKNDSAIVEKPSSSFAANNVNAVTRTKSIPPQKSQDPTPSEPISASWQCADDHIGQKGYDTFLRLINKLQCEASFNGIQLKGRCFFTNRRKIELIGLDWIKKLGLLDLPLQRFCNGVHLTWPSLAKLNQLTTTLLSACPSPAKVPKEKKEQEPGEKAPAASEPCQTPGRLTRSGARERRDAPTTSPSSNTPTAADSPDLSARSPRAKEAGTPASRRSGRKRMRAVPLQVNPQLKSYDMS
ncbi:unnamed protein product [Dibothriocephalus latus]|uniref:Uncharacterized protein n=1 Tax=Dibothriocephalus latus TaxID=60516 RepID=A0A3P6TW80_DIBLA|nr:unnamed protein product [Dibothriocephalus latus]